MSAMFKNYLKHSQMQMAIQINTNIKSPVPYALLAFPESFITKPSITLQVILQTNRLKNAHQQKQVLFDRGINNNLDIIGLQKTCGISKSVVHQY